MKTKIDWKVDWNTSVSYSNIYPYAFSKQKQILSKEEWEALNDLHKDNSILITGPDKGNRVVIINKLDYLNKISLVSHLPKLKQDKIIDDDTFQKLLPCGSSSLRPSQGSQTNLPFPFDCFLCWQL